MAFGSLVLPIPGLQTNLVQEGLLERAFHDGLFPNLQFRQEAVQEDIEANTGTEFYMSRPGLLPTVEEPLTALSGDPTPAQPVFEQWPVIINRYANTIDTHMPTSTVANANLFLRNINQLGLNAGQTVNRLPRNTLFKAYTSGQTAMTVAGLAADTTIHVASCNGFADSVVSTISFRPVPVSASAPLPVSIGVGAALIVRNVINVAYDNPADPYGPGTLTLSAALGAGFAGRTPVVSAYAPTTLRAGGGASVDALTGADIVTLQMFINAANYLRSHNVRPHDDGFFHAYITPSCNSQLFADPVMQRLNTALPQGVQYSEGFVGVIAGILFYMNSEVPTRTNSGALTLTGTNAFYARSIGAEVINDGGVPVGRSLVTGKTALYELNLDESKYVSEAGIMGKIGQFSITNNGMYVPVDKVRLILRAPIDRLQDIVAASWSMSAGFAAPSDATATTGPQRYKRAVVLEYADV
jgi:hypothetical protein